MTDSHALDLNARNAADIEAWHNFMDVQTPLTIELGSATLTVRKILELELQSIIQLQRSTAEGVDVVASGLHIARGEIIMIEDRMGVRVNEVNMTHRGPAETGPRRTH